MTIVAVFILCDVYFNKSRQSTENLFDRSKNVHELKMKISAC